MVYPTRPNIGDIYVAIAASIEWRSLLPIAQKENEPQRLMECECRWNFKMLTYASAEAH